MSKETQKKRFYLDRENISDLPREAGVYFLYKKGNILVYIGKAKSLLQRIPRHDKQKEFSRIGYEIVHYSRARKLENELLNLYRREHGQLPYYNKQSWVISPLQGLLNEPQARSHRTIE
jgi:predicted GIY-YIG superfamily endonuclease